MQILNIIIWLSTDINVFKINTDYGCSHSIQPKHRSKFTLFSTLELCGTDEGTRSTSYHSKGRSREFLGTFCGKKYLPLPGMRAGKAVPKMLRRQANRLIAPKTHVTLIFAELT